MIPTLGNIALIAALFLSVFQAIVPRFARKSSVAIFLLVTVSFACLIYAYVTSDFSVLNVVRNSHTMKPLLYKISGSWGNHEGSMLLWVWMLALWGALAIWRSLSLPPDFLKYMSVVQALLLTGFLLFVVLTSNPFWRIVPVTEGMGLNPLLQDPALAIHPPLLYAGYVGFAVTFCFAAAALVTRKVDAVFARALRPWVLAAWSFMTAGIAAGSFWAYYELGWGGFWFWDPVENASLMPWIAGLALLHSLAVLEKRGMLQNWTLFLCILSFSLSILGTFLVRSGILTSVHAFASDPARGIFILALLVVSTGGAFLLYALRAPEIAPGPTPKPVSRETTLLLNNVFLFTFLTTVFIGTLYPVILSALDAGSVSVGAPYYRAVLVPLLVPFCFLLGVAPLLAFGGGNTQLAGRKMLLPFCLCLFTLFLLPWKPLTVTGFMAAAWIIFNSLNDFILKSDRLRGLRMVSLSFYAMTVAHIGFAVMLAGITGATQMNSEKILWMKAGDSVEIAGYDLSFVGADKTSGKNYEAERGVFVVEGHVLTPENRVYPESDKNTSESALLIDGLNVLYVVMGEAGDNTRWVVRIYHHPLLVLIFAGAAMMAAGGGMAAFAARRKKA
jgi:cytochrome c-type biogenesis protein CcmF